MEVCAKPLPDWPTTQNIHPTNCIPPLSRLVVDPIVVTNDGITLSQVEQLVKDGQIDNIIISPGPGTPENKKDIGKVACPCSRSMAWD